MKHIKIVSIFMTLAFVLVACGEQPKPTVAPIPESPTAEPTTEEATVQPPAVGDPLSPLSPIDFAVDPDLVDVTWEWFQRTISEATDVLFEVPDPENYTLLFNADQTFNAQLDCNGGNGAYATDAAGSIFMQLGIMTAAACPPESLSNEMVNMFGPAQSYIYEDDGNTVIFKWAAGGPWDYYRKAGTGQDEAMDASGSLTGIIWNLTELNGQPPLPATTISAEFGEDGRLSGSSGCNSYSAAYEVDGDNININMTPVATTLMACPEPIMAQERAYMEALDAAETYEVSAPPEGGEEELVLFDANGDSVAAFSAVSQDLAGSSWDVISYNNGRGGVVSVIIGTEITANFAENGELAGNAGCNDYFGAYEADGENISMGPFGTTRKACQEPEGIMQQENEYLAALETAATYKIDGATMNMRTAEGATVANFRRMLPGMEALSDLIITPAEISLDTDALGTTWQAVIVPRTPYDASMPPGPVGLPAHIEILFGGATNPAEVQPGDPIMYIIPANTYRKLWNDAGNDAVTRTMAEIQRLNFILVSPAPTSGYPALPFEQIGGVNDLAVQVGRAVSQAELNTTSATQDGYRFAGRWAQDANPVTNQGLRYVYQGFTNDGVYLVSFWWPESTAALPDDVSEFTDDQWVQFNADPTAAINAAAEELNALSADQWDPDLSALDALVASLQIEGMTPSGLVDKTWEWVEGPAQPGSSEIVQIPDPSLYQVTYGSDGTMSYVADCNSGSMGYQLNNAGMTGGMLAQPGPATLAECEPGSHYQGFIFSLEAAQDYRVWAGGNEMELVLPAGGGVLLFRDANAPAPEGSSTDGIEACVTGTVTYLQRIALPEDAVVQVQIQDTSLADAPAEVIGEQIIENPGQVPIPYEVCYDPGLIQDNHSYSMSARITDGDGNLLWINDTVTPVITRGNPTEDEEIPVIQVGG
jgi:heat shock protein HslJ/uncharacterized lipoprotein YbaY